MELAKGSHELKSCSEKISTMASGEGLVGSKEEWPGQ